MSSYVEWYVKKNSILNFMFSVSFQTSNPKSACFFGKFTAEQDLKTFLSKSNSLKHPFLEIVIVYYLVLKNHKRWELRLEGFWRNRHSNIQKISAETFFFHF